MKPKVSIITPTYNHEKFIGRCIESVLSQTFEDWEMLILNDGSKDETESVIKTYDDPRIRYIYQKNKGIFRLSETYNKAVRLSEGEYIAILEGDDCWPSYKLEKQISYLEDRKDVVLSFGRGIVIDEEGKRLRTTGSMKGNNVFCRRKGIEKLLQGCFVSPAVTVMVRRDSLISIGGFLQPKGCPYVDYPTWLNLALKGKILFIDEVLGFWRKHRHQVTQKMSVKMKLWGAKIPLAFFQHLSADLKSEIEVKEEELKSKFFWYQGLEEVTEKNWEEARNWFNLSMKYGSYPIKLKSTIATVFSFFHRDFRFLSVFWNRLPLTSDFFAF